MRIDTELQNVKLDEVIDYLYDPPVGGWATEVKTLQNNEEGSKKQYWRSSMAMMSDRDAVVHIMKKEKTENGGGVFFTAKSIEDPDVPPVKDVVRFYYYESG